MGADHASSLPCFVRGAEVTAVAHVARARARARAEAIADSARAYDAPFALIADPAVMAVIASMHRGGHATKVELP